MKRVSLKLALVLVLVTSLLGTASLSGAGSVNADSLNNPSSPHKYFAETITRSVNVDGVEIALYPEFIDRAQALKDFEKMYHDAFMFLKKEFKLGELSENNWQEYYSARRAMDSYTGQVPEETMKGIIKIGQFFDVYANTEQNAEIENLSKQISAAGNQSTLLTESKDNLTTQLNLLTPFSSKKLPSATPEPGPVQGVTIGINLNNAITYATNHATSRNTPAYDSFESSFLHPNLADCTNFVSQILEAGGVPQQVYTSEYSGWWHKTSKNWLGQTVHTYSVSFVNANTFANYMGVSYTTTKHFDFSLNLGTGDIIGFDEGSDGDWEHTAFVTDSDYYSSNYGGKTYYDYKVAQHSHDYHAWTSNSDNGWENLEDNGYTYGILRR